MLSALVDSLVALGRKTAEVTVYTDKELRKRFVVMPGHAPEEHDLPPDPRAHTLCGLEDVLAVLRDSGMAPRPSVFHDAAAVVVYLDRDDRREGVRMPLKTTAKFQAAMGWKCDGEPREILRKLRQAFGSSVPSAAIAALRKLDFTRTNAGSTKVEHGRESLGKSVEAAVQQADSVPEFFHLVLPVYSNPWLRDISASIRVDVYLNVLEQTLGLEVHPDELETAIQQAQARLHEAIVTQFPDVPIFYGKP